VPSAASTLFSSSRISNGTADLRSFSIEQQHADVTQFFMNTGRIPGKMDLSFAPGQILTGAFDLMGATQTRAAATAFADTPTAATSYGIMNCVSGVGNILVRNAAGASILDGATIMQMSLSIDGKLRGRRGARQRQSANEYQQEQEPVARQGPAERPIGDPGPARTQRNDGHVNGLPRLSCRSASVILDCSIASGWLAASSGAGWRRGEKAHVGGPGLLQEHHRLDHRAIGYSLVCLE